MATVTLPPDLTQRLAVARDRIAHQRVESFVDYTADICGIDLRPVTLGTYNRLIAFDSPFVCGGAITLEALAVFVWIHHPDFSQRDARARRRVWRQLVRGLHPCFPALNAFLHIVSTLPGLRALRRFAVPTFATRFDRAVSVARHLIGEALVDLPRRGVEEDENGNPKTDSEGARVSLPAQILNTFARSLRISHSEAEQMPMRRVVQLLRECIDTAGGAGLGMMHPEEAKVWREYLEN